MDTHEITDLKGKLIYFGDPMCSWCWGIVRNLERLKKRFDGVLAFEMVMGGLRPGGGDPWNEHMKNFLRNHWQHVHAASGQAFNFELLSKDTFNYDTEPPSRAVVLVRDMKPEVEFDFSNPFRNTFTWVTEIRTTSIFTNPFVSSSVFRLMLFPPLLIQTSTKKR